MEKKRMGAEKKRWPEDIAAVCKAALSQGEKVKELEKRYGVPLATLYRWKNGEAKKEGLQKKETRFESEMAESAARGALAAVKLMERRIAQSAAAERRRERLLREIAKAPQGEGRKDLERRLKELEEPLSASSLTTMYKALADKKTAEPAPVRVEVVLGKEGEIYAG